MAVLAVVTPLSAQASFGVRGGMTLSTFAVSDNAYDDDVFDYLELNWAYKSGIHLGVTTAIGGDGPGLLLSAAYSQRGAVLGSEPVSGLDPGYDFKVEASYDLAYVDIGAFGRIPIGAGPYLLVGPTLSLRIACSATVTETLQGDSESETHQCRDAEDDAEDDPFKTNDFGISAGGGMSLDVGGRNLVVEALYSVGIQNILSDEEASDDEWFRNRGFTIRMGLDFGG